MRALVTGSSGVIGTELVKKLVDRGYEVVGIDRKDGHGLPITEIRRDINDVDAREIAEIQPDVTFHLAASFARTIEEPGYTSTVYDDNIRALHKVAESVAGRFVFASSYLVYKPQWILSEDSELQPRNLVGHSKLWGEAVVNQLTEIDGTLNAVSARIFRVYGRGSRDVIGRWICDARDGKPLSVYGGNQRFDYIHARDVAEGLIRLSESSAKGAVNLGYSWSYSPLTAAVIIREHLPCDVVITDTDSPGEDTGADISYLSRLTRWMPQLSLENGIADIIGGEA